MKRVLVIGGANHDLTARSSRLPTVGETLLAYSFDEQPGGKAANQAVAAAAWGVPTTFLARIGRDVYGDRMLEAYDAVGLDTNAIIRDPSGTGLGIVFMDPRGAYQTLVVSRANSCLAPADLDRIESLWPEIGVVVLQLESPLETVIEAARRASARRVPVILNAAPADRMSEELWPYITVLIVNEVEAQELVHTHLDTPQAVRQALTKLLDRVPAAVITLGKQGVVAQLGAAPPIAVSGISVEVTSTLGAGDAFVGVLSAEWVRHGDLARAVTRANQAAAVSVMRTETWFTLNIADVEACLSPLGVRVD